MKKLFLVFLGGFMAVSTFAATNEVKKYGYVPVSFPRDPVEVNQFSEHILLGQILEPIVDTDKLGNVIPSIAKSWSFEDKGLTIRFNLVSDRVFSNGKKLTSKDVSYTLKRIIEKKSQSSNFLLSVAEVQTPDSHTIILKLKEPNVSILKALSRDQVGIVPDGWTFDKESKEPLVGTGPYRLIKEKDSWFLKKNEKSAEAKNIEIPTWKLIYFADDKMNVPNGEVPDYIPGASAAIKKDVMAVKGSNELKVVEQISYAQTSAWWHPQGKNYLSKDIQKRAMNFIEEAFEEASKALEFERATGVIPKGVAGHVTSSDFKLEKVSAKTNDLTPLKIGFVAATFDAMLAKVDLTALAQKHGFSVEIIKISPTELSKVSELKPDVIFAGWAGGFNDPEGFIALLPTFVGKDFESYIGLQLAEIYKAAKKESDWTKRSDLFRKLNIALRSERIMAPGWRIPFSIIGKPELISEEATYRYTPRLHAVKKRVNL